MTMVQRAVAVTVALAAVNLYAEPMRTLLNKDGNIPNHDTWEVGIEGLHQETEIDDGFGTTTDIRTTSGGPAARYTYDKLTLGLAVPFVNREVGEDQTESGLGDVAATFDFRAYQDKVYPDFIAPYVRVYLPTGDEDKGLGDGEVGTTVGVVLGTTKREDFDFSADIGCDVRDGENRFAGGGSVVWNMNQESALVAELRYWNETDEEDDMTVAMGGICTRLTRNWTILLMVGQQLNGAEATVGGARLAYRFDY